MSASQDEIPPPPPPPPSSPQTPTQQTPHTVSTIKLPILKKGEYDIWAMKMEHYLAHTDYPIWEVIQNGNGPVSITTDTQGQIKVLPPRTAKEIIARERERKARTTLLMALPEDHLAKFHKMTDAKEMWDAIKSRFGGNDESKKMQKYILKQQFEGFSVSNSEGLHKGYDRRVDSLSFNDLYNNLRVFESDIKGLLLHQSLSPATIMNKHQSIPRILLINKLPSTGNHEDLEQIDGIITLKKGLEVARVAIISLMRMEKILGGQGTGHFAKSGAESKELQITEGGDAWNSGKQRCGSRIFNWTTRGRILDALVTIDGKCKESYTNLKKLYDAQREQLSDASIEIKAYSQGLKKVEAQLVAHQQGQFCTEPSELVSEPVVNESNVECQPKVWSDAPIIEEYESDSEDEYVSIPTKQQETPSFANQQVRENVKSQFTHSQKPKVDKKDLGYGFTVRACFVCGSLNHLIRDCDFHEKRMARKANLNSGWNKKTSQKELRETWNNVQRVNKQNQFVPSAVLTRTGKIPVNTARASGTKNVETAKAYLAEFQDFNGGPVAFGGSKGYITGKGKIKMGKLDFEDVCFVKELQHFNLFSVSQMCDKKNKVLFTDSECLVLSPEFKLPDENQGNLVRGLPSKLFQNDHTCVACQKGKQHKASCKAKTVSSISHSLQLLHMDLFGPTSVRSLNHKTYCLVITDDFSRFSWVFFLRTKDETSGILKDFIRQIENQLNQKVKTIRSDNGTEFKNKDVIEFCGSKGIKREYSNARTPQQNGVAERKNMTLIEAARTMLADSFLPNTFWAEAVSTACYVLNRVLVTKPHNKTPYELLTGKLPIISYIRPFGCHVTILNTIDHLGKFAGKSDEGFLVGYSLQSKAFRVYNLETKRVEENLHITFLENKPNVAGKGPTWLFDLDYLTDSMNYHPVRSENQANLHAGQQEANQNTGTEDIIDAGDSEKEDESAQDCFVLPIWPSYSSTITPVLKTDDKREGPREEEQVFMDELERLKRQEKEANEEAEALRKKFEQETENLVIQEGAAKTSSTNIFSTVSTPAKASSTNLVNTVSIPVSTASPHEGLSLSDPTNPEEDDSEIPPLEDIYQNSTDGIFTTSSYDDEGAVADFTNLETVVNVSPIPTSRIHSSHPSALILGDPTSAVQTRSKVNTSSGAHAFVSYICLLGRRLLAQSGFIKIRRMKEELLSEIKAEGSSKEIYGVIEFESLMTSKFSDEFKWIKALVKDEEASDVDVSKGQTHTCLGNPRVPSIDWNPSLRAVPTQIVTMLEQNHGQEITKARCHFLRQEPPFLGNAKSRPLWLLLLQKQEYVLLLQSVKCSSIHHALTIDSLPNQAIFDAIQLMGYEGDLTGEHFSGKVTPLFATMLVQPTKDEGAFSERPSEAQPTPSPAPTSEVPNEPQTDSSPTQTSEQRLARKRSSKKQMVHQESVSKQREKFAKGEPSVQRDPLFDEIPEDTVDHTETENAQDVGRTRDIVDEDKEIEENILSTEDVLSTDKDKVSTDKEKGPLPKIDPKDKGKKKIEEEDESESESDSISEAEKKFKQLESDEEMSRKIQEEWEGKEERNRIAEEKDTNEALIRNFDDIKARTEADRLLTEKL
ncbi:putative ribonuclease H-like domain-containing protein [Tanacetum coccineum]